MLWFWGRLGMTTDSLSGCMIRAREGISLPRGFNLLVCFGQASRIGVKRQEATSGFCSFFFSFLFVRVIYGGCPRHRVSYDGIYSPFLAGRFI